MNIIVDLREDVLFLSLNRPDVGNRLDQATTDELTSHFTGVDPLKGGPAVVYLGH
jgi:enoyl-CoA hydratase/carnithine racemase